MSITLQIVIGKDGVAASKRLQEMAARAKDVNGLLGVVGEGLLKTTHKRFDTQTDPSGKAWAPLSSLTMMLRGSAGPILTRSGGLKRSVTYQVSGHALRVGANKIYANIQQYGGTIKPKTATALRIPNPFGGAVFAQQVTLPARPYIGFGAEDEKETLRSVTTWLEVEG